MSVASNAASAGHSTLEQHHAIKLARGLGHTRCHGVLFGLVLRIGGRTHGIECVVVLALGVEHPGGRNFLLNIDLLGPIGVFCLAQLVAQLAEFGDVAFAASGFPERASPKRAGAS